jgi:hypothetical protein
MYVMFISDLGGMFVKIASELSRNPSKVTGSFISVRFLAMISGVIVDKFWYVCSYKKPLVEENRTYLYCTIDCSHQVYTFTKYVLYTFILLSSMGIKSVSAWVFSSLISDDEYNLVSAVCNDMTMLTKLLQQILKSSERLLSGFCQENSPRRRALDMINLLSKT